MTPFHDPLVDIFHHRRYTREFSMEASFLLFHDDASATHKAFGVVNRRVYFIGFLLPWFRVK